jgi:hypothetical protein
MIQHTSGAPNTVSTLADDNVVAVDEFISRAQLLSSTAWRTPRSAGKWSPCQEAQHLVLSLGLFREVILGQRELPLAVSPERSQALYATVMPKLRAREPLPTGARSPAEADPARAARPSAEDRESALRDLAIAGHAFQAALVEVTTADVHRQVQHPYFGQLTIEDFAIVAAAHTRHHMRFLAVFDAPEQPGHG